MEVLVVYVDIHFIGIITNTLMKAYAKVLVQSISHCTDTTDNIDNDSQIPDADTLSLTTRSPNNIHTTDPKLLSFIGHPTTRPKVPSTVNWNNLPLNPQPSSPTPSKGATLDTSQTSDVTLSTIMSEVTQLQQELTGVMHQCSVTQQKMADQTKQNQDNFQSMMPYLMQIAPPGTSLLQPPVHLLPNTSPEPHQDPNNDDMVGVETSTTDRES